MKHPGLEKMQGRYIAQGEGSCFGGEDDEDIPLVRAKEEKRVGREVWW